MAIGATRSEEAAHFTGVVAAREGRALGIHWAFAPVVDVNNNPGNPVINIRSYGEDPEMVGRLMAAFVRGAHEGGLLTTAKHFPGHGDTALDSHMQLVTVNADRRHLDAVELVPFRAAIAAEVASIMTAHILIPSLDQERPGTLSPAIVDGLLKKKMGYQGLVLSDDLAMKAISGHYGHSEATVMAIAAGCDAVLMCEPSPASQMAALEAVVHAVEQGRIPLKRIEDALARHMRVKERFLAPPRPRPASGAALRAILGRDEHQAVAAEMARYA
jgi:beta-glucosidase-like glycosyl hydrolase